MSGCLAAEGPVDSVDPEHLEPVSEAGAPIVGGSLASAYPEAALISMSVGGQVKAACSGSVIAPRVVLTAGHCVYGFDGWSVKAPFAQGQSARATSAVTYDWQVDSEIVDPGYHDVGLIFLDQPITLARYPTIADAPVQDGQQIVNVGRIDDGNFSRTALFVSKPMGISAGESAGYPFDYVSSEIIQSGDSGGPDMLVGSHTIVSVNSGAGGGTEVLARVDLLSGWIKGQLAVHGGAGGGGGDTPWWPPVKPSDPDTFTMPGEIVGDERDLFSWSVDAANVAYDLSIASSGDAEIRMWKRLNGLYYKVANTTGTRIRHLSSGPGEYVVAAFSPSASPQRYVITLSE